MLFLKSLPADRLARNDFLWPDKVGAIVESETWNPAPVCGGGLHGLINGEGNTGLLCDDDNAIWYAFESVDEHGNPSNAETAIIDDEKGKCRIAIIRAVGTRTEATTWLVKQGCKHVPYAAIIDDDECSDISVGKRSSVIAGDTSTIAIGDSGKTIAEDDCNVAASGDNNIVIASDTATLNLDGAYNTAIASARAEVTSGRHAKVISGCHSTVKVGEGSDIIGSNNETIATGDHSNIITEHFGKITTGDGSVCIAGPSSNVIGGTSSKIVGGDHSIVQTENSGIAIAGNYGSVHADNSSIAIVGGKGVARCGYNGIAIAGVEGAVYADAGSLLALRTAGGKYVVAMVGENGIKPDTYYRLNDENQFVEVPKTELQGQR